jgi:cytochrome oxidase Cu insertion factor (SCO1/SenC/PrrC family)
MTRPAPRDRRIASAYAATWISLSLVLAAGCRREPDDAVTSVGAISPAATASRIVEGPSPPTTTAAKAECCKDQDKEPPASALAIRPRLPDVPLRTHRGDPVHFHRDLVRGKVVALNFIFTTCQGVCPPLGVNFSALSRKLGDRLGREVELISISVDPVNDTPQRLAAWARRFDPDPRWTLVTGEKRDVDQLLKALNVYSADKRSHSSAILLGDESAGTWSRLDGLTPPDRIREAIDALLARRAPAPENPQAHRYFTDVVLINQDGERLRLYSDLMRGKVVVVQAFFCSCTAACPELLSKFMSIQERFRDRMGKDLRLLSISVDPARDTPDKIAEFARRNGAGPGWYFLTGSKEDVETALAKFGQATATPDGHSNLFMIGNDRTGLWKKAQGLARPEALLDVVASVLDDRGLESVDGPAR